MITKIVMRKLLFIVLFILAGCGGGGGSGSANSPWVKITQPSEAETYTAADAPATIIIAGESFISSNKKQYQGTSCDCIGLACLLYYGHYECHNYTVYDSGVDITVTNETTGYTRTTRLSSGDGYISHWSLNNIPLAANENIIRVVAADESGNWAEDIITINSIDITPPSIVSTDPLDTAKVSVDSSVIITFSEAIDTSVITTSSITISNGLSNITGTLTFSNGDTVARFTPAENLAYDTTYTVTLNDSIQDLVGNKITTTTFSFITTHIILETSISNLQATTDDSRVLLSWDASSYADYYNVYYSSGSYVTTASNKITGITTPSYTHEGLVNGDTYSYMVTAVNGSDESQPSTIIYTQPGTLITQVGTPGFDAGFDIAVDISGNIYFTGYTQGVLAGTENAGYEDIIIAKYDSTGNQVWIKQFGTTGSDYGSSIAVDNNGNSYITGRLSNGSFVTKYDTDGNQLWMKLSISSYYPESPKIAVDASGNSYILGETYEDIAGIGNAIGDYDNYIAKYDTMGNQLWIKQFGSTDREYAAGIAVDANGNSYLTGYSEGTNIGVNTTVDAYIVKYDSSGNQVWLKHYEPTEITRTSDITVDSNGNSYVTGYTNNSGNNNKLVIKHDSSGNLQWMNQYALSELETSYGYGIDIDPNGDILVTGTTNTNVFFTASNTVFISKYDSLGNELGLKYFNNNLVSSIDVDVNGSAYITGFTYKDFAGTGNAGGADAYILRLLP